MDPAAAASSWALIIEDDADNGEWIAEILKEQGYEAQLAMTLEDGFRKLAERVPACVVLDLGLPDGNGVEILRHVRRLGIPTKVAVVSGSNDFSTVGTAVLLEPDAFFRKPVRAAELMNWVASVCR